MDEFTEEFSTEWALRKHGLAGGGRSLGTMNHWLRSLLLGFVSGSAKPDDLELQKLNPGPEQDKSSFLYVHLRHFVTGWMES